MPRPSLLLLLLAPACSTQAITDGTLDLVDQTELDALASQLVAVQNRLDAEEAKSADLEQRLAEAETRLTDAEERLADVEEASGTGDGGELSARLDAVEADVAGLESGIDSLTGRVSAIEDSLGNHIWSLSTESDGSGGKGADFSSLGEGLDITVTTTEPILAWCLAHAYYGTPSLRMRLSAVDGSWEATSNSYEVSTNPFWKMYLTVMGSFTPPAAGDYTLECEGKSGTSWYDYDLIALQGASAAP